MFFHPWRCFPFTFRFGFNREDTTGANDDMIDVPILPGQEGSGDSGIVGTASDLAVFVRAVTGTNSFLNEATRKLLKSQPTTSPTDRPWYPIIHYDFGL